jgi:hypothetical protein
VSLEQEMSAFIKAGLEHHNATCPMPARAILLNTGNYELFGRTEMFGLPLEPRDDIPPKRFRIDCPGSASGIEDEIAEMLGEPVGEPITVTPEREPERAFPMPGEDPNN